jgi:phage terminase large subunit-like protein
MAFKVPKEILMWELAQREKYFPCKSFIPNIAQERFFRNVARRCESTGDFIKENHFIAGNGIGKTGGLAILLAGICLGKKFLHPLYFNDIEFFDHMEAIRKKRPLQIRAVCDAADVEDSGSLKQNISKWLPLAQFSGKIGGGKGYFTDIKIPNPDGGKPTVVNIKTHGQALMAHAGPNMDVVLFNEPPPEEIYFENASRTRMGGYIFGFMTPLNAAPYLMKVIDAPGGEGKISVTNGSIWDNCKDTPGTRGILSKNDIDDQVRRWMAHDPIMAEARIYGKFTQLSGAVFKAFNPTVHVIDPIKIDRDWQVYMAVDPHIQKPAFAVWAAVSPMGDWYVIAEYPTQPWDEITSTHLTIKDFATDWKRIESGAYPDFGYMRDVTVNNPRIGDPNMFKCRQPINNRTFQLEYEMATGWDFDVDVADSIELRHDRIKDLLKYDMQRPIDSMNRPHIYIFRTCENVKRAFSGYIYKQRATGGTGLSDQLDDKWICPLSALGYILVKIGNWNPKMRSDSSGGEYEQIMRSRSLEYAEAGGYNGERWC